MPKIFRLVVLSAVIFAGIPPVLWAEDPPAEASANTLSAGSLLTLPEVVTTANRVDTPLSRVTSSTTVVTANELNQKQSRTLRSALQDIPGLTTAQYGGPGQISPLFTRGANGESTLVMMDGIPLNDPITPTYSYDYLDQLTLEGVRQIEVVRGPQSALYGSIAMAGVVNILSEAHRGPFGGILSFEGGSYGTFRETASVSAGDEGKFFTLGLSRGDTAGFPLLPGGVLNNGNQNTTASLRAEVQFGPGLRGDFLARNARSRTSLDAYDPYTYLFSEDPDYFVDQNEWLLGGRAHWTLDSLWEQEWGFSYMDSAQAYNANPNPKNAYFQKAAYDGRQVQLDWQNNLKISGEETLVAGFQEQLQWGDSSDTNNSYYDTSYNVVTLTDRVEGAHAEGESFYLNSQTHLEERFFLNLGGRVDLHSQFGSHGTYQAGLAYFIPGLETKLKGNLGTGFMAPNLYQLNDPNYGSPTLQPEQNLGLDLGFEQSIADGQLRFGATYFHNDFTDLIRFDPATFRNANIRQAEAEGCETFLSSNPLPGLRLAAHYTYSWVFNVQTGQALSRRPENQAGMSLFYALGSTEWGALLSFVGDRLDYDYVNFTNTVNPEYVLLGLRASWKWDDHVQFFGRVDNLLDRAYQEIYGYATPGRSFYAGTKVSF